MSQCGALVYVLDAQQSDYESPLKKLRELIKQINEVKPNLNYEVFIHKVDTDIFQTNDQKEECLIAVQQFTRDLMQDMEWSGQMTYHLTSIYD